MSVRLIIFDLDGTLIDSEKDLGVAVNATRAHVGLAPLDLPQVDAMVGRGAPELVRRALGDAIAPGDLPHYVELFVRFYRRHALENTRLYPGVAEALDDLGRRGFILGVLTNKPARISRDILHALGQAGKFRFIYGTKGVREGPPYPEGSASLEPKKPDPVGILTMLGHCGLEPRQAMMVGDSMVDVLTGRNAGAWTCGVTYGFQPKGFEQHPPDILIDNLTELYPRLAEVVLGS